MRIFWQVREESRGATASMRLGSLKSKVRFLSRLFRRLGVNRMDEDGISSRHPTEERRVGSGYDDADILQLGVVSEEPMTKSQRRTDSVAIGGYVSEQDDIFFAFESGNYLSGLLC